MSSAFGHRRKRVESDLGRVRGLVIYLYMVQVSLPTIVSALRSCRRPFVLQFRHHVELILLVTCFFTPIVTLIMHL
jgi:hypothetical protein